MRSILIALFVLIFLIGSIPVMLIEWIIGKFNPDLKSRSSLAIVSWVFRFITVLTGSKVTIIGEEKVPKDQAVLYIINHRSFFDTIMTYSRVPNLTGYISKKSVMKVPLLNVWMKNLHCLGLDRDNVREGLKTILEAIEQVKKGISICIFPEGTRNTGDEPLLPFHEGSFKIAERSGCPVVPVTVVNTEQVWEAHFPWIKPAHVIIEYGDPIYTAELTREKKKGLCGHVHTIIKDTYIKNQKLI